MSVVPDPLDAIMLVMQESFEPEYGEAWTRRLVADALALPITYCLLASETGEAIEKPEEAAGFALSRHVSGEEELLLLAVRPKYRGQGIAKRIMTKWRSAAIARNASKLLLEMRDGNKALDLYCQFGFKEIGRRKNYYNSGTGSPIDAITFSCPLPGEAEILKK